MCPTHFLVPVGVHGKLWGKATRPFLEHRFRNPETPHRIAIICGHMPITPEDRARQNIDKLLTDAGWVVQDKRATNLSAAWALFYASRIALGSRNASIPYVPNSRPTPESLNPPNGACWSSSRPLIATRPAKIWDATRRARCRSVPLI